MEHPAQRVGTGGRAIGRITSNLAAGPGLDTPGAVDVGRGHEPPHPVHRQDERSGSVVRVGIVHLAVPRHGGGGDGEGIERVVIVVGGVARQATCTPGS